MSNINYSRLIPMHGKENDLDLNFIPAKGEIIIYDPDDSYNYSRIKVGDDQKSLSELEFSSGAEIKNGTTILKVPLDVVNEDTEIVKIDENITKLNNNLEIDKKVSIKENLQIGSGAKSVASNSLALGIVKSDLPTKSEGLASLAVGGDAVASGKYSIANGCQVQTGIPIWEIRKLISNLFTNNKITKTSNSSTNIITCTCTSAEIGQKTAIAESLTLNFSTKNSTAINNYCIVDNNCIELDIPMVANGTNENEKNYWINKDIFDSEFVNIIDNININNIGNNTFATGFRCSAIGQSTAAIGGWGSEAIGDYSIAIGNQNNKAFGNFNTVIGGKYNKITGNNSILISTSESEISGEGSIGLGRKLKIIDDDTIRIGKESGWNLNIDNSNTKCSLYNGLEIKYTEQNKQPGHNIILGDPNSLTTTSINTLLLGFSDKQFLRINSSGCTFTGNVNLPTNISVPENFIENIWS